MSESKQPTFLVNAEANPVLVQVHGKANYLNCNHFREFMQSMIHAGKTKILINFTHCKGMDSTFLGILAGSAIKLSRLTPSGCLSIGQLDERNRELVTNLGLQSLLHMEEHLPGNPSNSLTKLENREVNDATEVLNAHQHLVEAEPSNAEKFEDVIAFLKKQIEEDSDIS